MNDVFYSSGEVQNGFGCNWLSVISKENRGKTQLGTLRYPRNVTLVTSSPNSSLEIMQSVRGPQEYIRFVSWASVLALCNERTSMKVVHP